MDNDSLIQHIESDIMKSEHELETYEYELAMVNEGMETKAHVQFLNKTIFDIKQDIKGLKTEYELKAGKPF